MCHDDDPSPAPLSYPQLWHQHKPRWLIHCTFWILPVYFPSFSTAQTDVTLCPPTHWSLLASEAAMPGTRQVAKRKRLDSLYRLNLWMPCHWCNQCATSLLWLIDHSHLGVIHSASLELQQQQTAFLFKPSYSHYLIQPVNTSMFTPDSHFLSLQLGYSLHSAK